MMCCPETVPCISSVIVGDRIPGLVGRVVSLLVLARPVGTVVVGVFRVSGIRVCGIAGRVSGVTGRVSGVAGRVCGVILYGRVGGHGVGGVRVRVRDRSRRGVSQDRCKGRTKRTKANKYYVC